MWELDYLQLPNKEAFTYHIEQLEKWWLISEELKKEIEDDFIDELQLLKF